MVVDTIEGRKQTEKDQDRRTITTQGKHAEYRQSEPAQCCDMDGKRIGEADQVMGIQLNSCRFTVVSMTGTKGLTLEGSSQGCCGQE